MLLAAVPEWAITTSAVVGCLGVVVGTAKAVTGWAPVRWLWRRLVADPIAHEMHLAIDQRVLPQLQAVRDEIMPVLADVQHELRTNSGKTVKDVVNATSSGLAKVSRQMNNQGGRLTKIEKRLGSAEDDRTTIRRALEAKDRRSK